MKDMSGISGVEIMKQLNEGRLEVAPTEYLREVRTKISEACEELLDMGARIRPLMVSGVQAGWVRGLHVSERKMLDRWILSKLDLAAHIILLATTLTKEEIDGLNGFEIRSILGLINQMSSRDVSLFPYIGAFVTTIASETLWHGKGIRLSSFENRLITLPDGKTMKIVAPPDHSRIWAALCASREHAKRRLDDNFNALLIIRPWAGKNADPLGAELKGFARALEADSLEPWQTVIKYKKEVDVNDGWAHPGETVDDLKREMHAFIEGKDKHEQVMAQLERQMLDEASSRRHKMEEIIQRKGGPGVFEELPVIRTDAEVREAERLLKKGRIVPKPADREEREDRKSVV
jgi:hypothetical protein